METLAFVWTNGPTILDSLTTIVAACAAISALTPTPKDDSVFRAARGVLDVLALNWGNAKNEEQKRRVITDLGD